MSEHLVLIVLFCISAFALGTLLRNALIKVHRKINIARESINEALKIMTARDKWEESVKLIEAIPGWMFRLLGNHRLRAYAVVSTFAATLPHEAEICAREGRLLESAKWSDTAGKCRKLCQIIGCDSKSCCAGSARVRH